MLLLVIISTIFGNALSVVISSTALSSLTTGIDPLSEDMATTTGYAEGDVDVFAYFPDLNDDGLNVHWAHAVNSKISLNESMFGNGEQYEFQPLPHMLESDVIIDQNNRILMAHPPATDSDLDWQTYLKTITSGEARHIGAKVDFKSLRAVDPALLLAKRTSGLSSIPFWLNADICPGPRNDQPTINAAEFLRICQQHMPGRTLSLGWKVPAFVDHKVDSYRWRDVVAMLELILPFIRAGNCTHITFPVRALLIRRSVRQLFWLLEAATAASSGSCRFSLTLWTVELIDWLEDGDYSAIAHLRHLVGKRRFFADMPSDDINGIRKFINESIWPEPNFNANVNEWRQTGQDNDGFTYLDNRFGITFLGNSNTSVSTANWSDSSKQLKFKCRFVSASRAEILPPVQLKISAISQSSTDLCSLSLEISNGNLRIANSQSCISANNSYEITVAVSHNRLSVRCNPSNEDAAFASTVAPTILRSVNRAVDCNIGNNFQVKFTKNGHSGSLILDGFNFT